MHARQLIGAWTLGLLAVVAPAEPTEVRFTVEDRVTHPVSSEVFGQFLEIASWGEPGPEALVDPETGRLPESIEAMLADLHAPVIRFPGGIDIDYFDWTDRIDGVPGREGDARPISLRNGDELTNRFGHDEFLAMCERLDAEPMLVVNFREGLLPPESQRFDVVEHAARFIAYINGDPDDPSLPEELRSWAQLRVDNGRPEPWGVRYWAIGNEIYNFLNGGRTPGYDALPSNVAKASRLVERFTAVAEAMREVDPTIELIFDSRLGISEVSQLAWADLSMDPDTVTPTIHSYAVGNLKGVTRGEEAVTLADAPPADRWYGLVGVVHPQRADPSAPGVLFNEALLANLDAVFPGRPIMVTEWNWNGFGSELNGLDEAEIQQMQAIGSADRLHAIIRQGDRIKLATQSMMLGVSWRIGAVQADPEGTHPPFIAGSGQVTGLYAKQAGDRMLAVRPASAIPAVVQDLKLSGWGRQVARSPLRLVDVLVTRDDDSVTVHALCRSFDQPIKIAVDLNALDPQSVETAARVEPRPIESPGVAERDAMHTVPATAELEDGILHAVLPARSVSAFTITAAP